MSASALLVISPYLGWFNVLSTCDVHVSMIL